MSVEEFTVRMYRMDESDCVPYECREVWWTRTLRTAKKQIRERRSSMLGSYEKYWFNITKQDVNLWFRLKRVVKTRSPGTEVLEYEVLPPVVRCGTNGDKN